MANGNDFFLLVFFSLPIGECARGRAMVVPLMKKMEFIMRIVRGKSIPHGSGRERNGGRIEIEEGNDG